MASNFKQMGEVLDLVAPYDRTSGQGAQVGQIFGVAQTTVLSGATAAFKVTGTWELTKVGSQAWTVGQLIYWDNTNKRCTSVATGALLIGVAAVAAGSGAGVVLGTVRLNGAARPQEA
jgi:predicted RecA/RadA family phage recombinase